MQYKITKTISSYFIYLEREVKTHSFSPNICRNILLYRSRIGIIKGKQTIDKNQIFSLVEFEDNNRIWIALHEIKYI